MTDSSVFRTGLAMSKTERNIPVKINPPNGREPYIELRYTSLKLLITKKIMIQPITKILTSLSLRLFKIWLFWKTIRKKVTIYSQDILNICWKIKYISLIDLITTSRISWEAIFWLLVKLYLKSLKVCNPKSTTTSPDNIPIRNGIKGEFLKVIDLSLYNRIAIKQTLVATIKIAEGGFTNRTIAVKNPMVASINHNRKIIWFVFSNESRYKNNPAIVINTTCTNIL